MTEFEKITPQGFFPTHVWVQDLKPEVYEPLNRQVMKDLNEMTAPRPQLRPGQNWQTEQNLHEFEEFDALIKLFRASSETVLEEMGLEYGGVEITGCWANINPRGAFHIPHSHPNNFLSGIYYVQALPGADSVSFHDPRPQQEIIAPASKRETVYTAAVQSLPIHAGRMAIFPSWLVHSVVANRSEQLRISISFNIMFSRFAETMSQPKWSGIPLRRKS